MHFALFHNGSGPNYRNLIGPEHRYISNPHLIQACTALVPAESFFAEDHGR